uniref:Fer-1-like protein 6 n=1 Tax=Lygus hesperus TaxID=30085 RepID=A0A0A9ZDB9_LYGHE
MDLIKTSKDSLDISDTEDTFFNLSVTIYEGRDFVWLDTPTQIIVKFGRETKHTAVHPPTKNPYFNEYFVFDFAGYFNQLLDIPLSIKVYSSKYGPVGKGLLASARFDLATIWLQPNHFISRKLVVLSHPNDPRGEIKGYVLCDLGITSPGVPLPLSTEPIGKPTVVQKILTYIRSLVSPYVLPSLRLFRFTAGCRYNSNTRSSTRKEKTRWNQT